MPKKCFFVSPIGEEQSKQRSNSDAVLKYFLKPVLDEFQYEVIRSDQEVEIVKIDSAVIKHLREDDLVICDMTGHNPNVFYEFGYRQALGLPLIPIITQGESIPMDVATLRTISYTTTDLSQLDAVKTKIRDSVQAIETDLAADGKVELSNTTETGLGQSLLAINDKLDRLVELVNTRNTENVDLVAQQVAKYAKPQMSDDAALMQAVLPQLLAHPENITAIMKLAEQTKQV